MLDSTDGSTGTHNILHVNSLGRTWDNYRENTKYWAEGQTEALPIEQTWDHDPEAELEISVGPEGFFRTETVDGIQYNVYVALYHGELAPGEQTTQAMDQAYLDTAVDYDGENYIIHYTDKDGNPQTKVIDYNFENGINIYVKAFGIQSEGFDDVYAAYKAYQTQVA